MFIEWWLLLVGLVTLVSFAVLSIGLIMRVSFLMSALTNLKASLGFFSKTPVTPKVSILSPSVAPEGSPALSKASSGSDLWIRPSVLEETGQNDPKNPFKLKYGKMNKK